MPTNRRPSLFFLIACAIAVLALISLLMGNDDILAYVMLTAGPTSSLLAGLLGMRRFSEKGEMIGADPFAAMNSFFGLGMIVLTLSETITSAIWLLPDQSDYLSIIFILQIPGLLLWTIGVANYFQGCMIVLSKNGSRRVIGAVVVATFITTGIVERLSHSQPVLLLAIGAVLIILLTSIYSLTWLVWLFRGGTLRVSLGLLLIATLLFFSQYLAWNVLGMMPTSGLVRALTIMSYLIIGGTQAMNEVSET